MTRPTGREGFTLVETMIGVLILSIVGLTLAGSYLVGYRTISVEARQIFADRAVSDASIGLVRDLSSATTITSGTISASCGCTLTVTYGSPVVTATYRIDANGNFTKTVGASTAIMARGIQSITVAAGAPACYYTVTLQPSAIGSTATTLNLTQRVGAAGCS